MHFKVPTSSPNAFLLSYLLSAVDAISFAVDSIEPNFASFITLIILGTAITSITASITITAKSSTSVNPFFFCIYILLPYYYYKIIISLHSILLSSFQN